MPLRDRKLELLMIIPEKGQFESVRDKLSGDLFEDMILNETKQGAELTFPSFEIKSSRLGLVEFLRSQGLNSLFSGEADLSGFSAEGAPTLPAPSFVLQSTFVAVNEDGVEAGAGTSAGVSEEDSEGLRRFEIDRPFLFAIHDRPSGLMLFTGQVLEPRLAM